MGNMAASVSATFYLPAMTAKTTMPAVLVEDTLSRQTLGHILRSIHRQYRNMTPPTKKTDTAGPTYHSVVG